MCDSEYVGEEGLMWLGGGGICHTTCSPLMSGSLSVKPSPINFLGGSENGICDSLGIGHLGSVFVRGLETH